MNEIKIIFEDEFILIIDKPAGITVNRAETTKNEVTVQDWAEEKINLNADFADDTPLPVGEYGNDFFKRGGVVHRLDKETSGVLVLAKDPSSFLELQRQFKERIIEKTYIALSHGEIAPKTGEINVPVGRLEWNRMQFGVVPGGRESITHYEVLKIFKDKKNEKYTLVELYPKSGRTHQIRVHLKYIGRPIFSDFLYAGRKTARSDRKILGRVYLHAAKLALKHPSTGEKITFESPLPQELRDLTNKWEKIYEK